jgi:alanine racemase
VTRPGSPHRAWIEIDHAAIRANLEVIRSLAPGSAVIAVVKANAYGHGDAAVARTLVGAGVERLAVATVDEARRLRAAGIGAPILLLWGIGPEEASDVVELDLEPVVYDQRSLDALEHAATERRIGVHLKLDTGLGRQGIEPEKAVGLAAAIRRSRRLTLVGTMTHLAVPGEDEAYTEVQLVRLSLALDSMRSAGIDPGIVHVSATGAILAAGISFADAIRPGLALYGMVPAWAAGRAPELSPALSPVLSLRARPLRLFDLPAGEPVGYGLRYRATRPTRIAVLGIGYGDGWPRSHTNTGSVLVRGQRARVAGVISMDGLMVDLGEIAGVTYEDEFVLIGEQNGVRISADEVAGERRTINYEVTTALRNRLPRLHLGAD